MEMIDEPEYEISPVLLYTTTTYEVYSWKFLISLSGFSILTFTVKFDGSIVTFGNEKAMVIDIENMQLLYADEPLELETMVINISGNQRAIFDDLKRKNILKII